MGTIGNPAAPSATIAMLSFDVLPALVKEQGFKPNILQIPYSL